MAAIHGTCDNRFSALRDSAQRQYRRRLRHRGLCRRHDRWRARRRHLGRLGRRAENTPLAGRHHHQRLVHHQDDDVAQRAAARRSRRTRPLRARRALLAGVRGQRQGRHRGAPPHVAHVGRLRMGAAHRRRGPLRCRSCRRPPGGPGALVGTRHRLGLPRPQPGPPRWRNRAPHHRQVARYLFRRRAREAARCRLPHRPRPGRLRSHLERHPAASVACGFCVARPQLARGQDVHRPARRCRGCLDRGLAPRRDRSRQWPRQRALSRPHAVRPCLRRRARWQAFPLARNL